MDKEAIRVGLDMVEHGTLLDEEAIALMRQHGTYYVPTLVALFHICAGGKASGIPAYAVQKSHLVMERHKESTRQAHEAGVKIAIRWGRSSRGQPPASRRQRGGKDLYESVTTSLTRGLDEAENLSSSRWKG